ncbi:leucine rich repeat domain containing protein [Sporothrix brasiliensis 5110]|uniref:Leucine rich repeat domain containing protein n=1 Tax=Sporothrix brasiliensis 5110 TaxID=1398154 RepID=A0A0C2IV39_9PEZI|nr:leucine rich repeat domain containing protein [Sporothrix brasiliensis 5110]KIH90635.1 leucine rich repeat domain containing protein [Sporothrix brasiliensis 5110]
MDSEDGELFIKQLATFVRTHEKALANALQFRRQPGPRHGPSQSVSSLPTSSSTNTLPERPSTSSSTSSSLAAALSLGSLNFTSHSVKSAKLALTSHHLFYLLSRFEELGIPVGPMGIRIENLHDAAASTNYVSFLSQSQRSKTHGSDVGSIRSVSSIRSVMSGMSALWANFSLGSSISAARCERQKAALQADLKYLYSAFTKIPCLRLAPDWRARLIRGYEEFPFDSAVPLYVFKNVQALEVCDMDFRQFFGWDRLADQLRSLTLKRASIEDPIEILVDIVLDDMEKRRRRTSKTQSSPTIGPFSSGSVGGSMGMMSPRRSSPSIPHAELHKSMSMPGSPDPRTSVLDMRIGSVISEPSADEQPEHNGTDFRPSLARSNSDEASPHSPSKSSRPRSHSPRRPSSSRNGTAYVRSSHKVHRSGSGSSQSSLSDPWHNRRGSTSNLLTVGVLPATKWRFLKHLSLADNSLTSIPAFSLSPLSNTLHSLDLSSNLFTQIPDSLATLTALRALNLSQCMIDSLHSLAHFPLPAITALNLRANRLQSIAGIEKLYPLERLDLRDNSLTDPTELARLTGIPEIREVWVGGNPFTRTHKDYRITIFNLFRKTPGFTEDIIIDACGPSYSERKYLVERAPLPPMVPVIKPQPVPTIAPVDVSKPAIVYDTPRDTRDIRELREPAVLRKERPVVRTTSGESNGNATRRKRAPKRRIVDLATNNVTTTHVLSTSATTAPVLPPPSAPSPLETSFDRATSAVLPPLPVVPETSYLTTTEDNYIISRSPEDTPNVRPLPVLPTVSTMPTVSTAPTFPAQDDRLVSSAAAVPVLLEAKPAKPQAMITPHPVDTGSTFRAVAEVADMPILANGTSTGAPSSTRLAQALPPLPPQSPLTVQAPVPQAPATPTTPTRTPTKATSTPSPAPAEPWSEPQDWDVGGELYRRKIEALRDQVGEGYLSVLSEETWDPVRHPPQYHDNPFSSATTSPLHPSPVVPRSTSVQAIHSGRTLG